MVPASQQAITNNDFIAPQAKRGGRVKLAALAAPPPDYNHEQKGDALYSMEIALALEKLNFQMLYSLHETAEAANDSQMQDFVEEMLSDQVQSHLPVRADC